MDRFTGAYRDCTYCGDNFYTLQYNKIECGDDCRKQVRNEWQKNWARRKVANKRKLTEL